MSWDPRQLRVWRLGIAAVVAFDLVRMAVDISHLAVPSLLPPVEDLTYGLALSHALVWSVCLAGVVALVHHARAPGRMAGAVVALAATALLFRLDTYVRGEPNESLAHASAVLWGWLGGTAIARLGRWPAAARERLAATGAAALLGATYVAAGAIKLVNSGLAWAQPIRIQMLAVQYLDHPHPSWLTPLRQLAVDAPALAGTIAVATLALELGGGLYFVGPRVRAVLGTGLLAMHLGIWALTGILFPSVMALLLVLSFPWHRWLAPPRTPEPPEPAPAPRVWLGPAVCALAAALVLLIPQGRVDRPAVHPFYVAFLEGIQHIDRPVTERLRDGEGRLTEHLGPLHAGQHLDGGWTIAHLRVLSPSAAINVERDGATVQLQLVPLPDEGLPADAWRLGGFYLRYERSAVPTERFQAAMEQLRALLEGAAGADPDQSVRHWAQ
ncbi:MAG: hypothetical protein H6744_00425 [Deltaproteobacteria bacterium]|nr:hypothetical protein [Deltaproteobacteria bacterium]